MLGTSLPEPGWRLAQLGLAKGGLGLRDPSRHAGAAYVASVTKSFSLCQRIDSNFDPADADGGLQLAATLSLLHNETLEAAALSCGASPLSQKQLSGMVDARLQQCRRARRQVGSRRSKGLPNARFQAGSMDALPFEDARFDHVLLFHVLTYADDPARALAEATRVLRPGGALVAVTLDAHDQLDQTRAYGHVQPGFSPKALRALLRAAGLEVEQCARTSRERKKPNYAVVTAAAHKE